MSKICVINYGADDNSVSDFGDVRIVNVKSLNPGIFLKRRIKKYSFGYLCLDELGVSVNSVQPSVKGLFRRDIVRVISQYCDSFGIDCRECEIAVYGRVEPGIVGGLSELFSMVWLYGCDDGGYHNTFRVKTRNNIKTRLSVYADEVFGLPDSDVVFNLTDRVFTSVSNIEVATSGFEKLSPLIRNEAVRLSGTAYDIISFIK